MSWIESEEKAYQWFKNNIDSEAIPMGKEDSTHSDIYSPKLNAYVEIKDITNGARCGQFTATTIKDNPYAEQLYTGNQSKEICRKFVQYHYQKKDVKYFIIVDNDTITGFNEENFFQAFTFEMQKPYEKRSGTRNAPKKDYQNLFNYSDTFYQEGDKIFCSNESQWNQYISLENPFDYYINKTGELRKRSNTKNMTWHLLIKKS